MKESLATFRKAVNESADLQEKLKGGTDLVELGKENGHDFSAEDVTAAYKELQDDDDGELTQFEMDAVAGGMGGVGRMGKLSFRAGQGMAPLVGHAMKNS
jgi:predicted ribosomally synthesized peptide with nif11-like leader